ncbi:MAG TPA: NifB/NifX family molybdenum-iron cluster-binding protein [Syntrophales bacterium]|nr:NifB/NifX family molybdenum-iron cluster-binding protein [Syntrophales bacterium]HOL59930.1 NifB/NifX family molybdenum-iron cluster-binding protein [Syntrophales bacterium]HPO36248.1 NifB/NifX family molybdenum-iron cluster-binding protein [Syntrophales bacterium]
MKVAITTSGNHLKAPLDSRFGRAPRFLIYDLDQDTFEVIDNAQNLNLTQGAGIQSAQNLVKYGVNALICGHVGPKAFRVLKEARIKIYTTSATTVQEALDLFRSGKLEEASEADVESHW